MPKKTPHRVRLALAGLGTVGQGVVKLLQEQSTHYLDRLGIDLQLIKVFDRSYQRKDTSWISPRVKFTDTLEEFLQTSADVVVELIGGMDPADQIIQTGLEEGKCVVTANKLVMARRARDYLKLAAQSNSYLGFEASVAGGIPVIQVLRHSLLADRILRVRGILNGTCNFILSEMAEKGHGYEDTLAQAQSLGYAEADPYLDVSGGDARDKLAILSTLCFHRGINPAQIPTQGITQIDPIDFLYARKLDCAVKLLGVAVTHDKRLSLRVGPFLVDNSLPLSKFSGVLNAVEFTGASLGSVVLSGRGAGAGPTAVAVMADILNAARWTVERAGTDAGSSAKIDIQAAARRKVRGNESYPFYLRFFVRDRPGIIASLANILADRKINIETILEERWPDPSNLPFVITVKDTSFDTIQDAVTEMKKFDFNCVAPMLLPILRE